MGNRKARPGVAVRVDTADAMHVRAREGPWTLVDGEARADLGQIQGRPLEGQRYVDFAAALVDREAEIDAGRDSSAEAGHAAPGRAAVAGEVALHIGLR